MSVSGVGPFPRAPGLHQVAAHRSVASQITTANVDGTITITATYADGSSATTTRRDFVSRVLTNQIATANGDDTVTVTTTYKDGRMTTTTVPQVDPLVRADELDLCSAETGLGRIRATGRPTTQLPVTRSLRRAIAGAGVLLVLALMDVSAARAAPASGTASDTVRVFYGALLDTMRNATALGVRGRYQKLEPVVRRTFDLPLMTKLSIGTAWDRLTPDQREHAVSAFGRFVTATYARRFDGYSGEKFPVLDELNIDRGVLVRTQIIKSDGQAVSINYVTQDNDTAWQIRDIYLGGTISELATRRSEFAAILRTAGFDGLIATLDKKAADLAS